MTKLSLDLFAGMAHELRTPLGGIGGYAELLELGVQGPVTAAQIDALGRIRKNQQLMVRLISAFMNYAELAAGARTVSIDRFSALEAIREAIAARELSDADRTRIAMTGTADVELRTDRSSFIEVVVELLLDAVGSTDTAASAVQVDMTVTATSFEVRVASEGESIVESNRESAFVPFDRHARSNRPSASRHALSLPHARLLARLLGGDVLPVPDSSTRALTFSLPM